MGISKVARASAGVVQWAGQEIRVLDYVESQGQVLVYYTNELRHRGYGKFSRKKRCSVRAVFSPNLSRLNAVDRDWPGKALQG